MTRSKKDNFQPPPTELIISREKFQTNLNKRITIGKTILEKGIETQLDFDKSQKEYYIWNDYNSEYLKQSFNNEHNDYKSSYDSCANWIGITRIRTRTETPQEKFINHKKTITKKIENLEKLVGKTDLLKSGVEEEPKINDYELELTKNIFIVHGHDDRIKIEVARTIEKLGLKPIILSEQPNKGQTIIEKFEQHSNVGFAIVLLTADDLGKQKTQTDDAYRARQNVILEMGYFIGKLGRSKVFPLYEPGVELPSDLHGILYEPIDHGGGWKFKLAQELKACNYSVDANKLI